MGSSDFVKDATENGYKIHLFSLQPSSEPKNNKSTINESSFVSEQVFYIC